MYDDATLRTEVVTLLRALLRLDTSNPPGNETAAAQLLADYLMAAGVECELVGNVPERANLVARIRGTGDGPSLALVGHMDVVPADAREWRHPPFAGHLDDDGFVWGRGAVDMKNELATRAVALALLAGEGFRPRGDLLLIASADEEIAREEVGLRWLVASRPDLRCDYALNEGGGKRLPLADGRVVVPMIVGEKATLPVRVTAVGRGGHAAMPAVAENPVPALGKLVARLGGTRSELETIELTEQLLRTLAGDTGEDLGTAVDLACALHPGFETSLRPLFGTTIVPTRLSGAPALNVIPPQASVECDCRLVPGTTAAALEDRLRELLGRDLAYTLTFTDDLRGGTVSPHAGPLADICQAFLDEHDPGATLLAMLSVGFTDSHYLREAFGTVAYGFWPLRHTPLDVYDGGLHAADERIHVDDLVYATRFHLHACRAIGRLRVG